MLTEEQAKEKWCPFARVVIGDEVARASGNRFTSGHYHNEAARCLGSGCMLWKWGPAEFLRLDANGNPDPDLSGPSPWTYPKEESGRGYCGFGGRDG